MQDLSGGVLQAVHTACHVPVPHAVLTLFSITYCLQHALALLQGLLCMWYTGHMLYSGSHQTSPVQPVQTRPQAIFVCWIQLTGPVQWDTPYSTCPVPASCTMCRACLRPTPCDMLCLGPSPALRPMSWITGLHGSGLAFGSSV